MSSIFINDGVIFQKRMEGFKNSDPNSVSKEDVNTYNNTILKNYSDVKEKLIDKIKKFKPKPSKNVFVSHLANEGKNNFVGCYNDDPKKLALPFSVNDGKPEYTVKTCMNAAVLKGYPYFGLQNVQSNGLGQCYLGKDLDLSKKYGDGLIVDSKILWSTNTNIKSSGVAAFINDKGSLVIETSEGKNVFSTPEYNDCNSGGMINNVNATYGGNCKAPSGNATEKVNKIIEKSKNKNYTPIQVNNQTFGDPAVGCRKSFDIYYQCGNNPYTTKSNEGRWVILDCSKHVKACRFILQLENDGNMNIKLEENPKEIVWSSNTSGQNLTPNLNWLAKKGKYGVSYLKSGQILNKGEWIGSDDGRLMLKMEDNGNLVLYTSNNKSGCVSQKDGNLYGQNSINAIYKIEEQNVDKNALGKVGYVSDGILKPYPSKMLGLSSDYHKLTDTDNTSSILGNPIFNSTAEECKKSCNSNSKCYGVVFNNNDQSCLLKSSNDSEFTSSPNKDSYVRIPSIKNSHSCNKKVVPIDSVEWKTYKKSSEMKPNTLCDMAKHIEGFSNSDASVKDIYAMNDILNFVTFFINKGSDFYNNIYSKMDKGINQNTKYVSKMNTEYKTIGKSTQTEQNDNNIKEILKDSDILLKQQNYIYLGWSIVAICALILSKKMME